jgi:putative transposase
VRDEAYRAGVKLSDSGIQRRVITQAKTTPERGWLVEVPSVALVQSFRLTRNGFRVRATAGIFVAKVGEIRVHWSRELPSEPSSVTIIREPDGHYYASFVIDVPAAPLPAVEREAGVDVGITRLATVATTDGARTDIANPKHLDRTVRKLRRLEREKSRRQKGSINRDKTRRKVAIAHGKVARSRRDYHHKRALALVRENQVIHVEDLNIAGMVVNRRLARAISDAGWASSCGSSARRPTATGAH